MKSLTTIAAIVAMLGLSISAAQATTTANTGATASSWPTLVGATHTPQTDVLARGKDDVGDDADDDNGVDPQPHFRSDDRGTTLAKRRGGRPDQCEDDGPEADCSGTHT